MRYCFFHKTDPTLEREFNNACEKHNRQIDKVKEALLKRFNYQPINEVKGDAEGKTHVALVLRKGFSCVFEVDEKGKISEFPIESVD